MAKYSGLVGFTIQTDNGLGVWSNEITEKQMRGDIIGADMRYAQGDKVNDDVVLSHRISLIGNPFVYKHIDGLRYVTYLGVKWRVTSINFARPRIIVTLGGVWNGG